MQRRHPGALAVVALAALATVVSGCGGSGDPAAAPPTSPSPTPGSSTSVIPVRADPCSDEIVLKAVQQQRAGAQVQDMVCGNAAAIATAGDTVVFLAVDNGAWRVVASGAVDGDVAKLLPSTMSPSLLDAWKAKRTRRVSPTTAAPAAAAESAPSARGGPGNATSPYDQTADVSGEPNPEGSGGGGALSPECATTIASRPCVYVPPTNP